MSVEENKAILRRFIEAYNNRNLQIFEELVAPDFIDHTHQQKGREKFKKLFTMAFEGFPDWYAELMIWLVKEKKCGCALKPRVHILAIGLFLRFHYPLQATR